jgi:hypothetical protein
MIKPNGLQKISGKKCLSKSAGIDLIETDTLDVRKIEEPRKN